MKFATAPLLRRLAAFLLSAFLPALLLASDADLPGVHNFQKVNEQVYRGAQPTELGFDTLAKLGIKTVVDLRQIGEHSQAEEQQFVESRGMRYVSVPMKGMSTPTDEQVSSVLALLNDSSAGPVFVHCKRGADRTGAVIACYRIGHDLWNNTRALKEARSLGMSWYQRALQKYVAAYQPPSSAIVTADSEAPLSTAPPSDVGEKSAVTTSVPSS